MKVGDTLVVRPLNEIKDFEWDDGDDLCEGQEFIIQAIDKDMGMIYTSDSERYTIEKDRNGFNWETFFTLKDSNK